MKVKISMMYGNIFGIILVIVLSSENETNMKKGLGDDHQI